MPARSPILPARRRLLAPPGLAIAAIALAGAGSIALAADAAVSIEGFAFVPASVTVNEGDSVTWTNNDGLTHTATADGGSFDTGSIANGASASVTFNTAGSYPYHCSIHPQMTGTVVVQGAGATPAPTAPPPAPGATPRATAPPSDMSAAAGSSGGSGTGLALIAASAIAFGLAVARTRRAERAEG